MRMVIQLRNLILLLPENRFASGDILPKVYGGFGISVIAWMALISLFRLHISLVDVFWTILIKD